MLKQKIMDDMKAAMRARDNEQVMALRLLLNEIKNAEINQSAERSLGEDDVLKVVLAYHKKLNKTLKDYPEGEQKQKLKSELAIVQRYLPNQPSEQDIRQAVDALLKNTQERQFGLLMKQLRDELGPLVDGALLSKILKEQLNQ